MKKLGFISIALVLAMILVGIGLSSWNETLTVQDTVSMANLQAQMVVVDASVPDPNIGGLGTCSASVSGVTNPNDTLTITITGAYPGYNANVRFDVKNTGTMACYVTTGNINVTGPDGTFNGPSQLNANSLVVTINVPLNQMAPGVFLSSLAPNWPTISVYVPGAGGGFIDPVQGGTYTITVPLTVHQFNMP